MYIMCDNDFQLIHSPMSPKKLNQENRSIQNLRQELFLLVSIRYHCCPTKVGVK